MEFKKLQIATPAKTHNSQVRVNNFSCRSVIALVKVTGGTKYKYWRLFLSLLVKGRK